MGTETSHGNFKKMILLTLAIFVGICYIIYKMPGGCHGSCQQGRKPCECKDKE